MDYSKLKVADLKKELKNRGLSTVGNKTELQERLQLATLEETESVLDPNVSDLLDEDVLIDDDLDDDEDKSLLADESSHIEDESLLSTSSHSTKAELSTATSAPEKKIVVLKRSIAAPAPDATTATVPATNEPSPKVAKLTELTATERLELRMKKFGGASAVSNAATGIPVNTDLKRQARAERFGIKTTTTTSTPTAVGAEKSNSENKPANNKIDTSTLETVSVEVLKKRAERFGTVSSKLVTAENAERLAKRQDRFGPAAVTATPSNDSAPITDAAAERAKMRLERFKTQVK